ncbi:MAG TPA: stage II sporulation protein R [Syntrophomonadaceae bacterium]|nr:stage II sporulation protein R [Syntrophomonadaceae bacterium]HPR93263.1 stage II sporulation protein R [Syntrophomonadaceae bacterium]
MLKKISIIIILFVFTFCGTNVLAEYNTPLNKEVLRLHVIANSDSSEDQELKLQVKDHVVKMMQAEFIDLASAEEAYIQAEEQIPFIKAEAEKVIYAEGYDYPVEVYVGEYDFPVKSYGNIVFPAGNYQAVRIVIGEGTGKNWWCVLFPPLCLVASSDKGLCLDSPKEAEVTFKCLELIPKGIKFNSAD